MKNTKFDPVTGELEYTHNGYIFRLTSEAVIDALNYQGIDILHHVSTIVDSFAPGNGERIRVTIHRDLADDISWIEHTIRVSKVQQ